MLKQHHRFMNLVLAGLDLGVTYVALALAYYLRFHSVTVTSVFEVEHGVAPIEQFFNPVILLLIAVIWLTTFYFNGLYRPRRGQSQLAEVYSVFNAIVMGGLLLIGISFFYRENTYSRGVVISFFVLDFLLVSATRWLVRAALKEMRRRGYNKRHVMIAGAGDLGLRVGRKILLHPETGLELVGWLDDDPDKRYASFLGAPVMGSLDDASAMVERHGIDQLYVALPLSAYRRMAAMLESIQREGIQIKIIPDIMQFITLQAGVEDFDGMPVINLTQTPLEGWSGMVKRVVDLLLASIALVVLSPLMILFALLIKLTSEGPVLYRQERMGLDRRRFMIYKFRTMVQDAETRTGPVFAREGDPRVTPVGRFMRKFSIDELPQLINVVKGEMSLVGPRPERPSFVKKFKEHIPNYMMRHHVKSGMTGWAQVNGLRGNTSLEKRIEYDLYYIQNWSLVFDLYIMFLTLFRLHKNAV